MASSRQPRETSAFDIFASLEAANAKFEADLEATLRNVAEYARKTGRQGGQIDRKEAETLMAQVAKKKKELAKEEERDEKKRMRQSQRNVHAVMSAFNPQGGLTRFLTHMSRANSGFAQFVESAGMFGRVAGMISQVVSQASDWVKGNRNETVGAMSRSRNMGGGGSPAEVQAIKEYQRSFKHWDDLLQLGDNWSENMMSQLEDIGLKFKDAKVVMDKFHQSAAAENLTAKGADQLAKAFITIQQQEREANLQGRKFVMTRTQLLELAKVNDKLARAFRAELDKTKQTAFDINGAMVLINNVMYDNSRVKITPESVMPAWEKFTNYLNDVVYGALTGNDILAQKMGKDILTINQGSKEGAQAAAAEMLKATNATDQASAALKVVAQSGGIGAFAERGFEAMGLGSWMTSMASKVAPGAKKSGEAMTQGLIDGTSGIGQAMEQKGKDAVSGFNRGADIQSPSRKFFKSGSFIGEGLGLGIDSQASAVQASLANLITPPAVGKPSGGNTTVNVGGISTSFNVNGGAADGLGESLLLQTANVVNQSLTQALSSLGG
jgi:hypothetical protein